MHDDLLTICSPAEAGFSPERWKRMLHLAARIAAEETGSVALEVGRGGRTPGPYHFGRHASGLPEVPLRNDAIFLVASLTKPIVAMASLLLVERGLLNLNDRVADFLPPPLPDAARKPMTIRHLLTHTSGLPDMLPDNRALRVAKSPLSAFCEGSQAVALDFPPGRGVQYQSMGFVLLSRIVELVSGQSIHDFVQREILEPCGMRNSALGAPGAWFEGLHPRIDRIPGIDVPEDQRGDGGEDWNWNSRYWRQLGAPWGGLLSTPTDLLRFCQVMLQGGKLARSGEALFSPRTVAAATSNQLVSFPDVPEADRRCRGWGFGWRLQWPAHPASFADFLSPSAYGHWGATGTVFWIDPALDLAAVLLTPTPLERSGRALTRLSNAIVSALI